MGVVREPEPPGFFRLADDHDPLMASMLRLTWPSTRGLQPTEDSPGLHAQFIGLDHAVLRPESLTANAVTVQQMADNCPTGWNKPGTDLNYGEGGLSGHMWGPLEVDFHFGGRVPVAAVQTDSKLPFAVWISNDSVNWELVRDF